MATSQAPQEVQAQAGRVALRGPATTNPAGKEEPSPRFRAAPCP